MRQILRDPEGSGGTFSCRQFRLDIPEEMRHYLVLGRRIELLWGHPRRILSPKNGVVTVKENFIKTLKIRDFIICMYDRLFS